MIMRVSLLFALSLLAACDNEPAGTRVSLDWDSAEMFHVGAAYRVANVHTEHIPSALEGADEPEFDEHWTDEIFWTFQAIETGLVPTSDDELHPYALKADGSVASLSVLRAYVDASLNDDSELLESDPVVYLVFREDRDRLAAIISFTNVDGVRVERAWSSEDLGKSWSALSQSMLTAAPTYLAPFAATYEDDSKVLENGTELDTVSVDDGVVDTYYDDELGGDLVMSRYEVGEPWPTVTVSDNVSSRLLSDEDLDARRADLPFFLPDPPENFDYRAALASTVDIEAALVLDGATMEGGWEAEVIRQYQPWAGSWWPLRKAEHVFGWRGSSPTTDNTISDQGYDTFKPLKKELEQLNEEIRDMDPGTARDAKVDEYKTKQSAYVTALVDFYGGVLQGLQGGTITVAAGKVTCASSCPGKDSAGWEYDLDDLSPYDKYGITLYLEGQTYPNPFYGSAWALLNSWAANEGGDNSWWGYCNGWAGAAILEDEPRESVTVTAGSHSIVYETADQKGLTTALHYSTYSRFYGARYYKEGDDINDLTPKAFHQLITFYFREQGVAMVFDTTAEAPVWNFPAYGAEVTVRETTTGGGSKININTADAAALDTLPGIGETLSWRIIDYRETYGPFQSIEDITKVRGIGSATFNKVEDQITVDAFQRTFDVCADVQFSTDGVDEEHIDSTTAPRGFTELYCYQLSTDSDGRVAGVGTWDDPSDHPDFAWVPYSNPVGASSGGSENPYLNYGTYLDKVVDLRRE